MIINFFLNRNETNTLSRFACLVQINWRDMWDDLTKTPMEELLSYTLK